MPLIVDAYNVLHVTGVLPADLAGLDLTGLIRLISRSRWSRARVHLVCDGSAPDGPAPSLPGRVEVRYAGPGGEADAVIEAMIEESSAPRRLTVVSTDRRIQRAAGRRRAKAVSSEGFLRQLSADDRKRRRRPDKQPPPPSPPLDEDSVAGWIEEFGLDQTGELMRLRSAAGSSHSWRENEDQGGESEQAEAPNRAEPGGDDLLREAMREWPGRLDWDDLDMRKWLSANDPSDADGRGPSDRRRR